MVTHYHTGNNAAVMGDRVRGGWRGDDQGRRSIRVSRDSRTRSIAWQKVRYSKARGRRSRGDAQGRHARTPLRPDRGFYLAGDYLTYANA